RRPRRPRLQPQRPRTESERAAATSSSSCVFFFQAEDGIRDKLVTGVQTCALPICAGWCVRHRPVPGRRGGGATARAGAPQRGLQIGRASCRERVENTVVAVSLNEEKSRERQPASYAARQADSLLNTRTERLRWVDV